MQCDRETTNDCTLSPSASCSGSHWFARRQPLPGVVHLCMPQRACVAQLTLARWLCYLALSSSPFNHMNQFTASASWLLTRPGPTGKATYPVAALPPWGLAQGWAAARCFSERPTQAAAAWHGVQATYILWRLQCAAAPGCMAAGWARRRTASSTAGEIQQCQWQAGAPPHPPQSPPVRTHGALRHGSTASRLPRL